MIHHSAVWVPMTPFYRRVNQRREERFDRLQPQCTQVPPRFQTGHWVVHTWARYKLHHTLKSSFLLVLERLHGGGETWKGAFKNISETDKEVQAARRKGTRDRKVGMDLHFTLRGIVELLRRKWALWWLMEGPVLWEPGLFEAVEPNTGVEMWSVGQWRVPRGSCKWGARL